MRVVWERGKIWLDERLPAATVTFLPSVSIASVFLVSMAAILATSLPLDYEYDAQDLLEDKARVSYVSNLVEGLKLCISSEDPQASCSADEKAVILQTKYYSAMEAATERAKLSGCHASFSDGLETLPTDFLSCKSVGHPRLSLPLVIGALVALVLSGLAFSLALRRPVWLRSMLPRSSLQGRLFLPTWLSASIACAPIYVFSVMVMRRLDRTIPFDSYLIFLIDLLAGMAVLANFLTLDWRATDVRERLFIKGLVVCVVAILVIAIFVGAIMLWLSTLDVARSFPLAAAAVGVLAVMAFTWMAATRPNFRLGFLVTTLFLLRGCFMSTPLFILFMLQRSESFEGSVAVWKLPGIPVSVLAFVICLAWCVWIERHMFWDRGRIGIQGGSAEAMPLQNSQ